LIDLGGSMNMKTGILYVLGFALLVLAIGGSVKYRTDHQKAKDCVKQNRDKLTIEMGDDPKLGSAIRDMALRACTDEIKADRNWKGWKGED
jgi:hypothetical protein